MSESALSEQAGTVAAGYAFEGAALELGRLVEAAQPDAATMSSRSDDVDVRRRDA